MTFEKWWEDVSDAYFDSTGTYPNDVTKSFSLAAWEASQQKWKPIETAPKNLGDRIEGFVLLSESGDVIHGGWYKEIDGEGVWFDRFYGEPIDDESITHWMPLPEPPKECEK